MRKASQITVIKKKRRGGGHDEHGGSWKVAFADFTLAMMAFFLVLWLISISSEEEVEMMVNAMRDYSVLNGRVSPFEKNGSMIPLDVETYPDLIKSKSSTSGDPSSPTKNNNQGAFNTNPTMNILKDVIKETAAQLGANDNLTVDVVPQGVRIRLQDSDNNKMFDAGGTTMTTFFEDLLLELSPMLLKIQNGLVISGHTDAQPFGGNPLVYSNWDLSSERAVMARKVLQAGGVPDANVVQVTGMASTALANPDNPLDQANRRIEILILTDKAEDELRGIFGTKKPKKLKSRGEMNMSDMKFMTNLKEAANDNQPVLR